MSVDENFSELDLQAASPNFNVTLWGGGVVSIDIDDQHGLSNIGPFTISTGESSVLFENVNDETKIRLVDWGVDPTGKGIVTNCDEGYVWDVVTQSCVPIEGGGGGGNGDGGGGSGDDPFDIFDNQDAPFDEEDGVVERLLKTFTFGVNSTFRAFEAVVEGAMLALPAIIVIVAAVIAANLVVSATKTGTEKAKELIGKAGSMRQNMSIDIEGME